MPLLLMIDDTPGSLSVMGVSSSSSEWTQKPVLLELQGLQHQGTRNCCDSVAILNAFPEKSKYPKIGYVHICVYFRLQHGY